MVNMTCHGIRYVIRQGDSLYKISRIYRVPLALILKANPYADIYNLQVGEEICIPIMPQPVSPPNQEAGERPGMPIGMPDQIPVDTTESMMIYVIQPGDTLEALLERFDLSLEDFLSYNKPGAMLLQPGSTLEIPQSSMEKHQPEERDDERDDEDD